MDKNKQLENLKNTIFGKKQKEYNLIEIWHYLMLNYGYIPFDDFLSLDAGITNQLVTLINEMNEEQNKQQGGKRW